MKRKKAIFFVLFGSDLGCVCVCVCARVRAGEGRGATITDRYESEVAQSCMTLSDPMDCSLPGFSVHGIFQARVLEWGASAFSDVENPKKSKKVTRNSGNQ